MKNATTLALALAVTGLVTAPAFAADPELEVRASVSWQDLDLSTEQGVETLDRRIDRAARRVCAFDMQDTGTRIRSRGARECYARARESAQARFVSLVEDSRRGG
ncbi:MAG: UrcA family protein [Alteraurantiacibacter sp.]